MKQKKVLSKVVAFMVVCSLCFSSVLTVGAAEPMSTVADNVVLTLDENAEGNMTIMPRGTYLMDGECGISNKGNGRLYASGSTTANTTVNYVGVTVSIERLVNGSWTPYYSWSTSGASTSYVSTSKTLLVETGYYYRVCATHTAGMYSPYDQGASSTDGIWI